MHLKDVTPTVTIKTISMDGIGMHWIIFACEHNGKMEKYIINANQYSTMPTQMMTVFFIANCANSFAVDFIDQFYQTI